MDSFLACCIQNGETSRRKYMDISFVSPKTLENVLSNPNSWIYLEYILAGVGCLDAQE